MSKFVVGSLRFRSAGMLLPTAIRALFPDSYWKLDETAGFTAVDNVAGRNGTYQAGVLTGTIPGPYGSYPDFHQNGDGVVVPDDNAWSFQSTGGTVGALMRVGTGSATDTTGWSVAQKTSEWIAGRETATKLLAANNDTTGVGLYDFAEDNADGTRGAGSTWGATGGGTDDWHYVFWSFPASGGGRPEIHTDDAVTYTQGGPSGTRHANAATSLVIGKTSSAPTNHRAVAHLAVWDRLLSAPERTTLYDAARADGWIP